MSDLDFAELDKAVNNLVNKNKPNDPAAALPGKDDPVASSNEQSAQKPQGRFMDVFHHSSDMTGKENTPFEKFVPPPPAPRKVVSPLSSGVVNDVVLPETRKKPVASPPPVKNETTPAVQNDWPDPIEAAEAAKTDTAPSTLQEQAVKTAPTPLFLAGTKVEKRPLGGVSSENVPETADDSKKGDVSGDSEFATGSSSDDKAFSTDLPPELEADLVAIEEGGREDKPDSFDEFGDDAKDTAETVQKPEIEFIDDEDNDASSSYTQSESLSPPNVTEPEPETPKPQPEFSGLLAAGSIPQQYKTSAATSDTSNETHPMFFDADQYSKIPSPGTDAHKPHKTTLFQWIFIVVGLLLLGATLGAAAFVFVSGQ